MKLKEPEIFKQKGGATGGEYMTWVLSLPHEVFSFWVCSVVGNWNAKVCQEAIEKFPEYFEEEPPMKTETVSKK